jgi:hypothetical protein
VCYALCGGGFKLQAIGCKLVKGIAKNAVGKSYSLLTIDDSRPEPSGHDSPFTIHHSPFTIHDQTSIAILLLMPSIYSRPAKPAKKINPSVHKVFAVLSIFSDDRTSYMADTIKMIQAITAGSKTLSAYAEWMIFKYAPANTSKKPAIKLVLTTRESFMM